MSRSFTQTVILFFGIIMTAASLPARATIVELKVPPNNLIATAEYSAGKAGMPAVILIHGFLQTRDSPTIRRLADGLSNIGYTTLTPTLTLGISGRIQSLSCAAIHTHTLQSDSLETEKWIAWLTARGYKNIVLIGHSKADNQILYYFSQNPAPQVKKGILLSLVDDDFRATNNKIQEMAGFAQQKIKAGDTALYPYKTDFCEKYMSTAKSYLSYHDFSRRKVLKFLRASKRPVDIIFGSSDDRMGKDWPEILKAAGYHITIIKESNHFFEDMAEFELMETVRQSLIQLKMEH